MKVLVTGSSGLIGSEAVEYKEQNPIGDHICYISDLRKLLSHYPNWKITKSIDNILSEMVKNELKMLSGK